MMMMMVMWWLLLNCYWSCSFGRPGVDCHLEHDAEFAVIQLLFLINEVRTFSLIV